MRSLHFRKGCYVGNEIISKTLLTKAIRRKLCGIQFNNLEDLNSVHQYLKSLALTDIVGDEREAKETNGVGGKEIQDLLAGLRPELVDKEGKTRY